MSSSVIRNHRYDAAGKALDIVFTSGRRYRYLKVPPDIYEDFRAAPSKGEFFNAHIRDRFDFERAPGR
jgi:hypothetical protein